MYAFYSYDAIGSGMGWYGKSHVFGPCLKMTKIINGFRGYRDIGLDLDAHFAG
jgi:hypothetical protein